MHIFATHVTDLHTRMIFWEKYLSSANAMDIWSSLHITRLFSLICQIISIVTKPESKFVNQINQNLFKKQLYKEHLFSPDIIKKCIIHISYTNIREGRRLMWGCIYCFQRKFIRWVFDPFIRCRMFWLGKNKWIFCWNFI